MAKETVNPSKSRHISSPLKSPFSKKRSITKGLYIHVYTCSRVYTCAGGVISELSATPPTRNVIRVEGVPSLQALHGLCYTDSHSDCT